VIILKTYEYIDETKRTFPTIGIEMKKGDRVTIDQDIISPYVQEVTNTPPPEEPKINNENTEGSDQ